MKKSSGYREVTPEEEAHIRATIDGAFGVGVAENLLKEGSLVLLEKKQKAVYWVSKPLYRVIRHLEWPLQRGSAAGFHSVGIQVGLFVEEQFLIGVELVRELAQYTTHCVEVTPRGEQLFLYGKNLQKRSLKSFPVQFSQGTRVVIQNERKEALGLGELLEASETLDKYPPQREVIKNLKDLGTRYLRKGA